MSRTPYNDVFKMQNNKLLPSTFKKGIISSVNVAGRTVNVSFVQNPNVIVKGIPLAAHIVIPAIPSQMIGQSCRVDLFNETANGTMVIAYLF